MASDEAVLPSLNPARPKTAPSSRFASLSRPQSATRRSPGELSTSSIGRGASHTAATRRSIPGLQGGPPSPSYLPKRPPSVQAIARKPPEALAEEIVALKEQLVAQATVHKHLQVRHRKLQADLNKALAAQQQAEDDLFRRARNSGASKSPRSPTSAKSPQESSLIHALKGKVGEVTAEKDRLAVELQTLKNSTRATRVEELEVEVNILLCEVQRQTEMKEHVLTQLQQIQQTQSLQRSPNPPSAPPPTSPKSRANSSPRRSPSNSASKPNSPSKVTKPDPVQAVTSAHGQILQAAMMLRVQAANGLSGVMGAAAGKPYDTTMADFLEQHVASIQAELAILPKRSSKRPSSARRSSPRTASGGQAGGVFASSPNPQSDQLPVTSKPGLKPSLSRDEKRDSDVQQDVAHAVAMYINELRRMDAERFFASREAQQVAHSLASLVSDLQLEFDRLYQDHVDDSFGGKSILDSKLSPEPTYQHQTRSHLNPDPSPPPESAPTNLAAESYLHPSAPDSESPSTKEPEKQDLAPTPDINKQPTLNSGSEEGQNLQTQSNDTNQAAVPAPDSSDLVASERSPESSKLDTMNDQHAPEQIQDVTSQQQDVDQEQEKYSDFSEHANDVQEELIEGNSLNKQIDEALGQHKQQRSKDDGIDGDTAVANSEQTVPEGGQMQPTAEEESVAQQQATVAEEETAAPEEAAGEEKTVAKEQPSAEQKSAAEEDAAVEKEARVESQPVAGTEAPAEGAAAGEQEVTVGSQPVVEDEAEVEKQPDPDKASYTGSEKYSERYSEFGENQEESQVIERGGVDLQAEIEAMQSETTQQVIDPKPQDSQLNTAEENSQLYNVADQNKHVDQGLDQDVVQDAEDQLVQDVEKEGVVETNDTKVVEKSDTAIASEDTQRNVLIEDDVNEVVEATESSNLIKNSDNIQIPDVSNQLDADGGNRQIESIENVENITESEDRVVKEIKSNQVGEQIKASNLTQDSKQDMIQGSEDIQQVENGEKPLDDQSGIAKVDASVDTNSAEVGFTKDTSDTDNIAAERATAADIQDENSGSSVVENKSEETASHQTADIGDDGQKADQDSRKDVEQGDDVEQQSDNVESQGENVERQGEIVGPQGEVAQSNTKEVDEVENKVATVQEPTQDEQHNVDGANPSENFDNLERHEPQQELGSDGNQDAVAKDESGVEHAERVLDISKEAIEASLKSVEDQILPEGIGAEKQQEGNTPEEEAHDIEQSSQDLGTEQQQPNSQVDSIGQEGADETCAAVQQTEQSHDDGTAEKHVVVLSRAIDSNDIQQDESDPQGGASSVAKEEVDIQDENVTEDASDLPEEIEVTQSQDAIEPIINPSEEQLILQQSEPAVDNMADENNHISIEAEATYPRQTDDNSIDGYKARSNTHSQVRESVGSELSAPSDQGGAGSQRAISVVHSIQSTSTALGQLVSGIVDDLDSLPEELEEYQ